jgi:hypothetical protein
MVNFLRKFSKNPFVGFANPYFVAWWQKFTTTKIMIPTP